jgi:hypothetical protein
MSAEQADCEDAAMNDSTSEFQEGLARMAAMTDVIVDQIRKLAELREAGVLTDEEFTAKKQELLSRL